MQKLIQILLSIATVMFLTRLFMELVVILNDIMCDIGEWRQQKRWERQYRKREKMEKGEKKEQ